MDIKRISEIIKNKEIKDIYYQNKVVWIQELNNESARIGFLDGTADKNVSIYDLKE